MKVYGSGLTFQVVPFRVEGLGILQFMVEGSGLTVSHSCEDAGLRGRRCVSEGEKARKGERGRKGGIYRRYRV